MFSFDLSPPSLEAHRGSSLCFLSPSSPIVAVCRSSSASPPLLVSETDSEPAAPSIRPAPFSPTCPSPSPKTIRGSPRARSLLLLLSLHAPAVPLAFSSPSPLSSTASRVSMKRLLLSSLALGAAEAEPASRSSADSVSQAPSLTRFELLRVRASDTPRRFFFGLPRLAAEGEEACRGRAGEEETGATAGEGGRGGEDEMTRAPRREPAVSFLLS